ncbi:hypothetical protein [Iodobacter fluviatilis]|uniref:Uncharacterized protein n=1 Tax=Iodobacter fluviatilis TaxID=537 RepID=A0A377Q813_9NEIS|nr:hypothetical protein [Iodobacter fluviatilis]TCU88535.1 hypothetical protein EV682_103119 [Iodobacter fluviatilis]STQ91394.1 Uncharacterised protein [Iodobacter fluviatilis]
MFITAVTAVVGKNTQPFQTVLCPDQYVGRILKLTKEQIDFEKRVSVNNRPANQPCVILILESPHIMEFNGQPGPAKGPTGKRIREHLQNLLPNNAPIPKGLILLNAIQNQCSLGVTTKTYRDKVFLSAWDSYAREDFIQRLKNVLQVGDLVVNACTKGNDPKNHPELRQLVECAIRSVRANGSDYRFCHPVSWYSEQNRKSSWKVSK